MESLLAVLIWIGTHWWLWLILVAVIVVVVAARKSVIDPRTKAKLPPPLRQSLVNLPEILAPQAERLKSLLKPCVSIRALPAEKSLDPAASKFGGIPYLLPGEEWPKGKNDRPLTFIGQINFDEFASALREKGETPPPDLPSEGVLGFFYDMKEMPWGFKADHQLSWRFIWHPEPNPLESPLTVPEQEEPPVPCVLLPSVARSMPSQMDEVEWSGHRGESRLSDEQAEAYGEMLWERQFENIHQVLGYASLIQNDPRLAAVQFADRGRISSREDMKGLLREWRLLWQIGSDNAPGFMWGDSGFLYVLVRDEDLRQGRFDNLWLVLQCS